MNEVHHLNPFDSKTSEGGLLRLFDIKKKDILPHDGNPAIEEELVKFEIKVQMMLDSFKANEYLYQLNFDKLKDEIRDLLRVLAKKTRVFNITDFTHNVLIKMALGDLIAKTEFLFLFGPQSCGINPRGKLWYAIYQDFSNKLMVCGDIEGFDFSHNKVFFPVMEKLLRIAYQDHFSYHFAWWAVMSCILAIRFNRKQGRILFRGNSSGNWITTWLNTLVNMTYFCVCIIWLGKRNGVEEGVLNNLIIRLYSDDNLSHVPYPWFNSENMVMAFHTLFHMNLTSVDKGALMSGNITIDEANFLSRNFVFRDGYVYAPLELDKLLSQLYYVRTPKKHRNDRNYINSQLQQNLDNVTDELFEYSSEDALKIVSSIKKFISEHSLPLHVNFNALEDPLIRKLDIA